MSENRTYLKIDNIKVWDHKHNAEYLVKLRKGNIEVVDMFCLNPFYIIDSQCWQADTFRSFVKHGSIERIF